MKKMVSVVLAAIFALSLTACGGAADTAANEAPEASASEEAASESPAAEADAAEGFEIAMITDMGSIDDKGFNQGAWDGVRSYAEEKGVTHKYYKPAERGTDAYVAAIDLAVQGGAKIIVTPGFSFQEPVFIAQESYPDVKFILLDGVPTSAEDESLTADNTVAVAYAEEDSGFLAGYAAVMDGNTKLGFMGGVAVPAVVRFGYGFLQGVDAAAKELGITDVQVNYNYTGSFDATPEAQTLAATWLQNGTEIIFACGSGVGNSVLAACESASPTGKAICVDIDWADESETVVTSAMKSLGNSVYQMLEAFYADEFPGGESVVMDAARGGVALPMENSRFTTFSQEDYDTLFGKLADGTYAPLADLNESGDALAITDLPLEVITVNEV